MLSLVHSSLDFELLTIPHPHTFMRRLAQMLTVSLVSYFAHVFNEVGQLLFFRLFSSLEFHDIQRQRVRVFSFNANMDLFVYELFDDRNWKTRIFVMLHVVPFSSHVNFHETRVLADFFICSSLFQILLFLQSLWERKSM